MQSFNFLKAFCMDTAVNCLPFFKKHTPIPYETVDNNDPSNWHTSEESRELKNDIWNDNNTSKPPIELNTMIPSNTNDLPISRGSKNSTEKNNLIGNINEDKIKKEEASYQKNKNEPDYFQSLKLNTNEKEVKFNNVINSQSSKVVKANLDKGFSEKFKLDEDNIEPGGNWLDEQDIKL